MAIGIKENEFWEMNPRKIMIHIKAYRLKVQRDLDISNTVAHLQGSYFCEALLATVGNMFASKKSKAHEYPQKPYELNATLEELDEKEKQRQRDLFVANYYAMMTNFNMNKEIKEGQEQ